MKECSLNDESKPLWNKERMEKALPEIKKNKTLRDRNCMILALATCQVSWDKISKVIGMLNIK